LNTPENQKKIKWENDSRILLIFGGKYDALETLSELCNDNAQNNKWISSISGIISPIINIGISKIRTEVIFTLGIDSNNTSIFNKKIDNSLNYSII